MSFPNKECFISSFLISITFIFFFFPIAVLELAVQCWIKVVKEDTLSLLLTLVGKLLVFNLGRVFFMLLLPGICFLQIWKIWGHFFFKYLKTFSFLSFSDLVTDIVCWYSVHYFQSFSLCISFQIAPLTILSNSLPFLLQCLICC